MKVDKLRANGDAIVTGSLLITQDLTVNGCVYLTNAEDIQIQDDIIQLNYGGSNSGGGIEVSGTNATGSLLWDGNNQVWKAGTKGSEVIIGGNTYKEAASGTSFTITHNLNETYPSVTFWDTSNNQMVIPQSVTTLSENQISVVFAANFTGMVVVQR